MRNYLKIELVIKQSEKTLCKIEKWLFFWLGEGGGGGGGGGGGEVTRAKNHPRY